MSKDENKLDSQSSPTVFANESQRKCLSLILRDCDQAISGLLDLLGDPYSRICLDDLTQILPNVCKELQQVLGAAQKGTFCALSTNDCTITSYFVGCEGVPIVPKIKVEQSSTAKTKLNILEN